MYTPIKDERKERSGESTSLWEQLEIGKGGDKEYTKHYHSKSIHAQHRSLGSCLQSLRARMGLCALLTVLIFLGLCFSSDNLDTSARNALNNIPHLSQLQQELQMMQQQYSHHDPVPLQEEEQLAQEAQQQAAADFVANKSVSQTLSKTTPLTGPNNQRISLITFWNRDRFPGYFREFFHSVKLNADTVDLLFINRLYNKNDKCIDFAEHGVELSDNIKVVCINEEQWRNYVVGFLCSQRDGWDCTEKEYDHFEKYFTKHHDWRSAEWRPLQGYMFRELMQNDNQFWAFVDNDMILGRMDQLPFDLMSKVSWVTFHEYTLEKAYFAGQLTIFNYGEKILSSVWKRIPHFESAQAYIENKVMPSYEEKMWSWAYISTKEGMPGAALSYILFPDQRGDDDANSHAFLISGNDVLHLDVNMTRLQAENVLLHSRAVLEDSSASEGSNLEAPKADPEKWLAQFDLNIDNLDAGTIVEETEYVQTCPKSNWVNPEYRLCILNHNLTVSNGLWRATFMHSKDQAPGKVYRRLDLDTRPRMYSRKLYKHHLTQKKLPWLEFPPFPIEKDQIMLMERHQLSVFPIGDKRDETIYLKKPKAKQILGGKK